MWTFETDYIINQSLTKIEDIMPSCSNFQWTDDVDTLAVTVSFDCIIDLAEGRSHVVLKKDGEEVWRGVITQKTNTPFVNSYVAQDFAFYLNKNERIIQFQNVDAKTAIYNLLLDAGLTGACIPLSTQINKVYKGQTISDIITDILTQCSLEIGSDIIWEMRQKTLWIDKITNLKLVCDFVQGRDYQVLRRLDDMIDNVIVTSNDESSTQIIAQVKDDANINTFGMMTKVLSVDGQNESQARNTANNYLKNFDATYREITIPLLDINGGEKIRAGRLIKIAIPQYGITDGYYKVKNAQHTLNENIHMIDTTIDFSGASFQELGDENA